MALSLRYIGAIALFGLSFTHNCNAALELISGQPFISAPHAPFAVHRYDANWASGPWAPINWVGGSGGDWSVTCLLADGTQISYPEDGVYMNVGYSNVFC